MKLLKNLKGFSLIEILLYLTLMIVVVGGVMTFSQEIFDTSGKAKIMNQIDYESIYALNKISSYTTNSININSPTISQTSETLSFNDTNNTAVTVSLINNQIDMTFGNNPPIPLTSNKIKISNLTFTNLGLPNTKGLIKISFTADNNTDNERQIYNFTNNYEIYATPKN